MRKGGGLWVRKTIVSILNGYGVPPRLLDNGEREAMAIVRAVGVGGWGRRGHGGTRELFFGSSSVEVMEGRVSVSGGVTAAAVKFSDNGQTVAAAETRGNDEKDRDACNVPWREGARQANRRGARVICHRTPDEEWRRIGKGCGGFWPTDRGIYIYMYTRVYVHATPNTLYPATLW